MRAWVLSESKDTTIPDTDALWHFDSFDACKEALAIPFEVEGQRWDALDQYCGNPGCPCREASLEFYRIDDHASGPLDPAIVLRVDLASGRAQREDGRPPAEEERRVLRGFQQSLGSWVAELSVRRELLRTIARRCLPSTAPVIADPKVGRNDLCPCGSGRKYKTCCLGVGGDRK